MSWTVAVYRKWTSLKMGKYHSWIIANSILNAFMLFPCVCALFTVLNFWCPLHLLVNLAAGRFIWPASVYTGIYWRIFTRLLPVVVYLVSCVSQQMSFGSKVKTTGGLRVVRYTKTSALFSLGLVVTWTLLTKLWMITSVHQSDDGFFCRS